MVICIFKIVGKYILAIIVFILLSFDGDFSNILKI